MKIKIDLWSYSRLFFFFISPLSITTPFFTCYVCENLVLDSLYNYSKFDDKITLRELVREKRKDGG